MTTSTVPKKEKKEQRITATSFYQYSKCPAWPWHEAFSSKRLRAPVSAMTEKLWKDGLIHEEDVIKKHWKKGDIVTVEHEGDLDELALLTLEHMKSGVKIIYHGVLINGRYVGIPDLLERIEGKSEFGDWMYLPCDIKNSSHVTDVHRLQLSFYAELLKRVQGVKPKLAFIIDADHKAHEVKIDAYEDRFQLKLGEIEKLLAGEKPSLHLYGSCKQSPYFKQCILDAEKCEDISLIYKIRSEEREKLVKAGCDTLPKLASADIGKLKRKIRGLTEPRLRRLKQQAETLRDKKAIVIDKHEFPSAKTEIYFDMESDPLRGLHYLFGCLVVRHPTVIPAKAGIHFRQKAKAVFVPFLAKNPKGEEKAWKDFQKFIAKQKDLVIYHYGWYEISVIKELTNRYGITKAAARIFGDRSRMIDLLPIVSKCVLFPIYFYSLKDIAKFLGFRWRASDASGANSIAWYHDWLERKDKKLLQKIVDYNEDDVRATQVLVEWMKKQA